MHKVFFIINQKARQAKHLADEILKHYNRENIHLEYTQYAGHARELAFQAIYNGYRQIISAGGDGSLNETLNGILDATSSWTIEEKEQLRLGVIPIGTGNDFIRSTNSPNTIVGLKQSIDKDRTQLIDVGLATFISEKQQESRRYFINVVDVGLGGYVSCRLKDSSRFLTPFLTYQKAIISSLFSYKNKWFSASSSNLQYQGRTMLLTVANGKYFGSGIGIAPDANITDGKLDVVVIGDVSKWEYIRNIRDAQKCKHLRIGGIIYQQVENIQINSKENKIPVDMDGEFVGYTPLQVQVKEKAIAFYI